MAWVLCTFFPRPALYAPAAPKTQYGRIHQREMGLPLDRFSSQPAATPEVRMLTSKVTHRGIYTVNRELLRPSRYLCEPNSSCTTVFSTFNMIISGYWVGPDVEDGWGYVEASVNQVSD